MSLNLRSQFDANVSNPPIIGGFKAISSRMNDNLDRYKSYMRKTAQPIASEHPLHLFSIAMISDEFDAMDIVQHIQSSIDGIDGQYGLTSNRNKGTAQADWMTGSDNEFCTVMAVNELNGYQLKRMLKTSDWRSLEPLTYMLHGSHNLSTVYRNVGDVILQVDLGILGIMLNMWHAEQRKLSESDPAHRPEGLRHFLNRYVIPNAMRSFLSIAMFNTLTMDEIELEDAEEFDTSPPFHLDNVQHVVDQYIGQVHDYLSANSRPLTSTMPLIKLGLDIDVDDLCSEPEGLTTVMNSPWVLLYQMYYIARFSRIAKYTDKSDVTRLLSLQARRVKSSRMAYNQSYMDDTLAMILDSMEFTL